MSDKFVFNGDKVSEVQGQLTLKGKTHPVVLKALKFNCYINPLIKREVCGGDFETTIMRSQWDILWGLQFGFEDDGAAAHPGRGDQAAVASRRAAPSCAAATAGLRARSPTAPRA